MMKKIKSIYKVLAVGFLFYLPYSCDYLNVDKYFNDLISLDTVFARQEYLERYLWGAAGYLPGEGSLYEGSYAPYSSADDGILCPWQGGSNGGTDFYLDRITPFSGQYDNWGNYYRGIRKTNTIFARINECLDLKPIDNRAIRGLTHFLRGYLYYHLLMQYGPVPVLSDDVMDASASVESLSFPRNTYDECVDYICKEMEAAIPLLPEVYTSNESTRPTKYAAMSVISRLKLHQASPFFNGGRAYAGWVDEAGKEMISSIYDEEKWAQSALASLRIISANKFMLHIEQRKEDTRPLPSNVSGLDFPNGAGNIDPLRSYRDMFNGEKLSIRNSELIYYSSFSDYNLDLSFPVMMGGYQGLVPTHALVSQYKKRDGRDVVVGIDNDHEPVGERKEFSDFIFEGTTAKRYDNMEARFYASIGFCESFWEGSNINPDYEGANSHLVIKYYNQLSAAATQFPNDKSMTGYAIKKFVHAEDNFYASTGRKSKSFPIFRYAEILMNYVEAINELSEKTYTYRADGRDYEIKRNVNDIVKYFNMIRYRAGLPGITAVDASDPETMRKLIKRERQVEFAFEGRHRYHDVRRWGIMTEVDSKPMMGLDITKSSEERAEFYTPVQVKHPSARRHVGFKHYFWPIHNITLRQNSRLKQTPGWE